MLPVGAIRWRSYKHHDAPATTYCRVTANVAELWGRLLLGCPRNSRQEYRSRCPLTLPLTPEGRGKRGGNYPKNYETNFWDATLAYQFESGWDI